MSDTPSMRVENLIQKGVKIPNPQSVDIGDEVDPAKISGKNVTIFPGCRIYGESTLIMYGAQLGGEAPVTIQNCQIGPDVKLKGGFCREAVFLKGSQAGSGSHVRESCIFEEQAKIAHTVGLKQTILFPFVTLGSLINFCDCLMAGGTSRKNHSEVGSSYIHFNFTPNQDKATPSLLGDVPRGVMLDQRPIFLGGQGGLVGPCRLAFGTVIAAGTIHRKDELRTGRMLFGGAGKGGNTLHQAGVYRGIKRIFYNNVNYIGNLLALMQWYRHVRPQFVAGDFSAALHTALMQNLQDIIAERITRLADLAEKMPLSIEIYKKISQKDTASKILVQQNELYEKRAELVHYLRAMNEQQGDIPTRDQFIEAIICSKDKFGQDYIQVIQSLDQETKTIGSAWLQGIVDHIIAETLQILPSFC